MASTQRNTATAQRPNGSAQGKICQFKLVLLGESAVGKSSLVLRFVKGQFHEFQESTIGAAFLTQTVCIEDTAVKFEIWDTGESFYMHDKKKINFKLLMCRHLLNKYSFFLRFHMRFAALISSL